MNILLIVLLVLGDAIIVIDLQNVTDPNILLAIQSATGLSNRNAPTVYTISSPYDAFWLNSLALVSLDSKTKQTPLDFLSNSYKKWGGILHNQYHI